MKKLFGLGKKSLYLGVAFLVLILLWTLVSGNKSEGFYTTVDGGATVSLGKKQGSCDGGKGGASC